MDNTGADADPAMVYSEEVPKILVVDDDPTVRGVVVDYLTSAGMQVSQVGDGAKALAAARQENFDLIVLDLMLPQIDGFEVYRRLRGENEDIRVVMLTARAGESDRILGLELGADDYLTKPFSPRELVLRVQSVLRRSPVLSEGEGGGADRAREIIRDGQLSLDLRAKRASQHGKILNLTMREYDLLEYLVTHPDEVFSREQLMVDLWGSQYGDQSTVTVHVRRLREKIESDPANPQHLITVWGRGYRWEPAPAIEHAAPAPPEQSASQLPDPGPAPDESAAAGENARRGSTRPVDHNQLALPSQAPDQAGHGHRLPKRYQHRTGRGER